MRYVVAVRQRGRDQNVSFTIYWESNTCKCERSDLIVKIEQMRNEHTLPRSRDMHKESLRGSDITRHGDVERIFLVTLGLVGGFAPRLSAEKR